MTTKATQPTNGSLVRPSWTDVARSMVSCLGVAALRLPVGKTAFGRSIRQGTVLAHPDDGFSPEMTHLTPVIGGET